MIIRPQDKKLSTANIFTSYVETQKFPICQYSAVNAVRMTTMIRNKGVCCIVLALEENDPPVKFKTITYKSFSALPREAALEKLGGVIENNLKVTWEAVEYCGQAGHNYRLSSDVFPLITYKAAAVNIEDLPNAARICELLETIKNTRKRYAVRISCHPDQFNVLASDNTEAVARSITELNFQAWFMTQIGCPLNYDAPLNIHINRSHKGELESVARLFNDSFKLLSDDARLRLVLENDDKQTGWSVMDLYRMHHILNTPITFDYLHHKCHPGNMPEDSALVLASLTWGTYVPLFHYSESIPGHNNPRKHADYASKLPETYNKTFDLDFEFKMKEKSFENL